MNIRQKLKQKHVLILIAILILAIVLRIYVFSLTSNQGLWWDEAEYMAKAKYIAFGHNWVDFWNPHKPILLSLVTAPFFLLGIGEISARLLVLIFSCVAVTLIYFPVKEFFNSKQIGIIASFLLAVYWVHIFFTGRVLVGLPSTALFLAFWYCFVKGFVKKQGGIYLWLTGLFFGLAFMLRVVYGMIAIPIVAYAIFENYIDEKLAILKRKDVWIAILLLLITLSPLMIFLITEYPQDPIGEFLGFKHNRFSSEAGAMLWSGVPKYIADIPYGLGGQHSVSQWIFLGLFVFGFLIYFSDLALGFDKILKSKKLRLKLFILGYMVFLVIIWGRNRAYVEQRDWLSMAIFIFGIIGVGTLQIKKLISKHSKKLAVILIILLFAVGAYYNVAWGLELTKSKANSPYNDIKSAGLWIKQDSQKGDIVYSTARKQMLYYTELEVLDPGMRDYGNFPNSEKTKEEMIQELETNKNIKYIEMDVIEQRAASPALQEWLSQNSDKFKPAMVWYADPQRQQPLAVVYKSVNP